MITAQQADDDLGRKSKAHDEAEKAYVLAKIVSWAVHAREQNEAAAFVELEAGEGIYYMPADVVDSQGEVLSGKDDDTIVLGNHVLDSYLYEDEVATFGFYLRRSLDGGLEIPGFDDDVSEWYLDIEAILAAVDA